MNKKQKIALAATLVVSLSMAGAPAGAQQLNRCGPILAGQSGDVAAKAVAVPFIACNIPTASHEGLIAMAGLLGLAGAVVLRRRRFR